MKASETPEKIYLNDSMSTDTIGDLWPEWFDAEVSNNSIEYTRTDAFIEKACEFFEEHLCCYIKAQDFTIEEKRLKNDFKEYMKGE